MFKSSARPNGAICTLLLRVITIAAAELSLQEQNLLNQSVETLNRRQVAVKQEAVLDPHELEKEHYGRLHAKHPVRHCCTSEECAFVSARVAFVASLRRCGPRPGSMRGSMHPKCWPARSVHSSCSQSMGLAP